VVGSVITIAHKIFRFLVSFKIILEKAIQKKGGSKKKTLEVEPVRNCRDALKTKKMRKKDFCCLTLSSS